MPKIKVTIEGLGKLDKDFKRREKRLTVGMKRFLLYLVGYSAKHYLHGPYPVYLSHKYGKGTLARTLPLGIDVQASGNKINGVIGVPAKAKYGAVWESKTRIGKRFKNGHPKYRPFILPAYQRVKRKWGRYIKEAFYND